jgi:hypothetical protein
MHGGRKTVLHRVRRILSKNTILNGESCDLSDSVNVREMIKELNREG